MPFPEIDPIAIQLGPLAIRWYGLAYLSGIAIGWYLLTRRARTPGFGWTGEQIADLIFYAAIGLILGGRLGYVLFYNFADFLRHPLSIVAVWQGGMSFHGGLLGGIAACAWYARRMQRGFFVVIDLLAPIVPIGLLLGRIANFVNAELWGKPTDLPWGVVFPGELAGALPRHPSQLYEAFLEGIVLFAVLWPLSRRPRRPGLLSALLLGLYGMFRCAIEFVREPDAHLGYLAGSWLTRGQLLSLPMVLAGAAIYLFYTRRQPLPDAARA
jgi:phosphatidylglycerol:prolipoprotein diacylglycerol transferase